MSAVDQKVGWALSAASVSMLHVDEPLRHVNLIVRPLCFDLSVKVNAAAGLFTYAVERQNNGGVIIILLLQRALDRVGEIFASFSLRRDEPDIGNLQLAAVVDAQPL